MKQLAYLYIILTAFFYSTTSMFANTIDLSIPMKTFFMSLFGMIFMFILTRVYKVKIIKDVKAHFYLLTTRGLLGLVSTFALFYSVNNMNFADATILNLTSPIFVIIFSYLILKEKINKTQIAVVIVSFIGITFIVQPNGDTAEIFPAIMALFSGLTAGLAYTIIRSLNNKVHPFTIAFHFCFISTLILLPYALLNIDVVLSIGKTIFPLMLMGLFYALAQVFMAIAYKYESASKLSIFLYFQLLFSTIYSYFLFDQKLDLYSIIGMVIVLSASIYLYYYNNYKNISK